MTAAAANTQDTRPEVTTHPLLGVAGVLLGALILGLQHVFAPHSIGLTAMGRAAEILEPQVRQQAYTLAISDRFFSWLHAAWRVSWGFPLCPKCQLSIGGSLLHQLEPNEMHIP